MSIQLPYGIDDLDPVVEALEKQPCRVRCYVRGCSELLQAPCRGFRGEVCPRHGIRCHYSSAGPTYCYVEPARNIIASRAQFRQNIIGHPFKYESHRLGLERSEDSLSWNVFRSLQEASCLAAVADLVTGESIGIEPFLYLWGIGASDDWFEPWGLLIEARRRFESNLPVDRPLTEPDIALHLPGRYLILIEAKFTSRNTFYQRGPRKDAGSLTLDELVTIYRDDSLGFFDFAKAEASQRIPHQLWRNTVFAASMAAADHPRTKAYHVNLVRDGHEEEVEQEFRQLLRPRFQQRFCRITWEEVLSSLPCDPRLTTLRQYMRTKTAGLKPAFSFG